MLLPDTSFLLNVIIQCCFQWFGLTTVTVVVELWINIVLPPGTWCWYCYGLLDGTAPNRSINAPKCVTDEFIRVCHVTDPAELRQTVCHHRDKALSEGDSSMSCAPQSWWKKDAPRADVCWLRAVSSGVGEEWERLRVHARLITTRYPTNASRWPTDTSTK